MTTTANIAAKGTNGTGITEDLAQTLHNNLGRKVLAVVEPERFLPLLRYSAAADGKKEIAKDVFGLDLPPVDKSSFTAGRVAVWSNDLLRSLVGLENPQEAAAFLRWAKVRPTG